MSRTSLHALAGLPALTYAFLPAPGALALAALLVAHNVWLLPRLVPRWMRPPGPRADSGILSYPLVVLAATWVFRERLDLAAAVWAMLACGDAAASAAGRRLGRHALPWNRAKSLEGAAAFVAAAACAAWIVQALVSRGQGGPAAAAPIGWLVAAALAAALAETLDAPLDDNVRIGAAAALVLAFGMPGATDGESRRVLALAGANLALGACARRAGVISSSGLWAGAALGTAIGAAGGLGLFGAAVTFVVLGLAATRLREARLGAAEPRGTAGEVRGPRHAVANLGLAAAAACASGAVGDEALLRFAAVGALAAAAADTTGTEVGQAFARRAFRLIPPGLVPAGTPGGVSLPGTAAGLVAGAAVAAAAAPSGVVTPRDVPFLALGAALASLLESAGTALAAGRWGVGPHARNVLNTAVGAALAAAWLIGSRSIA